MKIEELEKELEGGNKIYKGVCHDCGEHVDVMAKRDENGTIIIEGGALFQIRQKEKTLLFYKCDTCFKKDKTLRNFKKTEVYSRVVGYLRPISGWNKGKLAEYAIRKEFTNTEGK